MWRFVVNKFCFSVVPKFRHHCIYYFAQIRECALACCSYSRFDPLVCRGRLSEIVPVIPSLRELSAIQVDTIRFTITA